MRENWEDERLNAAINQLRSELRDMQRLMLQGVFFMCVIIQVFGFFVAAVVLASR